MNNFRAILASALLSLSLFGQAQPEASNSVDVQQVPQWQQEARSKVKAFAMQLKSTLKQELKTNGPVSAVKVCNEQAPNIAQINSSGGWQVSRTALEVRNPANQPESWERDILERFETQLANGTDPKTLEYAEVVDNEFRYMKAIPTGSVCLACHGSEINPELQQHIKSLYPQDQATGFSLGDLRGAFSLTRKLD